MPSFEIPVKKIEYGHKIIKAKNLEEARKMIKTPGFLKTNVYFYPGEDVIPMDIVPNSN